MLLYEGWLVACASAKFGPSPTVSWIEFSDDTLWRFPGGYNQYLTVKDNMKHAYLSLESSAEDCACSGKLGLRLYTDASSTAV